MTRRILFWFSLVAVIGLAGLAVICLLPDPGSQITKENFDKIQEGMSGQDVVVLVGPPGDYTCGQGEYHTALEGSGIIIRVRDFEGKSQDNSETMIWYAQSGAIVVRLDIQQQVVWKLFGYPIFRPTPGFFERIKAKLGW